MTDDNATNAAQEAAETALTASQDKPVNPAAQRALAEAEQRRKAYLAEEAARPKEIGGRGGKEPGRYGDWEIKGLTSDF